MTEWRQAEIVLPEFRRGCHLITDLVVKQLPHLLSCEVGLMHLFIMHTSASLSINENADPDVPIDLTSALDRLAPESAPWRHTCEGPDDMPAHVKATITGSSVTVPVTRGQLRVGTWQGIYLCEHRNHGGRRRLVATLHGQFRK